MINSALTILQAESERILKSFAEECDGTFGTLAQAIDELEQPRVRHTKPTPLFRGQLTLGDPDNKYGDTLSIDVERYPRTMIRRPPTASSYAVSSQRNTQASTAMMPDVGGDGEPTDPALSNTTTSRVYMVDDPTDPSGKREVDFEDLAKGYEYGRSAVPISDSDWNVTKLETKAGLEIVGFIPTDNVCLLVTRLTSLLTPGRSIGRC